MTNTPPLALVPHFRKDAVPTLRRRLSAAECDAMRRMYTDDEDPDNREASTASNLLEECARGALWIACGCRHGQPWPIMYPQHTRSRSLMLVRNYDRPDHAPSCPFTRLRNPRQSSEQSVSKRETGFIILHETRADAVGRDAPPSEPHGVKAPIPKLARILFRLLHEARLDEFGPGGLPQSRSAWRSLTAAIESHSLDLAGHIPLKDVVRFGLDKVPALAASLRDHAVAWPAHIPPQGYLIGVVHQVDGSTLSGRASGSIDPPSLTPVGSLWRFGEASTPGPWLSISLVGCEPGGHWFVPLRTYLHPLYRSWSLLPVDSNAERQTLDALLGFQKWLPCTITKPLPGYGADGDTVRPDFIVRDARHRTVCVETMGYTTQAYRGAKLRTHPQMSAHYGPVICHAPSNEDAHSLRRALTIALLN